MGRKPVPIRKRHTAANISMSPMHWRALNSLARNSKCSRSRAISNLLEDHAYCEFSEKERLCLLRERADEVGTTRTPEGGQSE